MMVFVMSLLGIIVFIMIFQFINYKKSDKLYLLQLDEDFGKKISFSSKQSKTRIPNSYYLKHKEARQIDDITWFDLSVDDVLSVIDRTQSDVGAQVLYYIFRTPLLHVEEVIERRNKIFFWKDNKELRNKVSLAMHHCGKSYKTSLYDCLDSLNALENKKITPYICRIIALILAFLCIFPLKGIGVVLFIVVLISNIYVYYQDKAKISSYVSVYGQILLLIEAASEVTRCLSDSKEAYVYSDLDETLIQLLKFRRKSNWDRFSLQDSNPFVMIINLIGMLIFSDLIRFWSMKKDVSDNLEAIDKLVWELGSIDAFISLAGYITSLGDKCCISNILETKSVLYKAKELYHPLLENPVPNSISLDSSILLTGSNASGKSTFLKSIAINAIFSQCMGVACATSYEAPPLHIMSVMAIRDDICAGDSFYMAEIKAVKKMMDAAICDLEDQIVPLCLLDELLSGTNTEERIAAGREILHELVTKSIFVCAATHDIELTYLLPTYKNYHFEEELATDDVDFSYQLKDGPATTRNAIALLNSIGFPDYIIHRAEAMVDDHRKTGKWSIQKG